MTKAELMAKVSAKTSFGKSQTEKAVNSVIDVIKEGMKKGDKLSLVGFGTFSVVKRKARNGRNPRTGAVIKIPAKKAVKFSVSSAFNREVNGVKKAPAKTAKKKK